MLKALNLITVMLFDSRVIFKSYIFLENTDFCTLFQNVMAPWLLDGLS